MRLKVRYLLAVAIVGAILICPAMAASPFPDVDENADYAEAVEYLNDVGIMKGDDKGNFNPNQTVTRSEMATIICNMLGETEDLTVSDTFSDVSATHWANKYITKASELGFVSGYGGGRFGPNDPVTYEQAVTMVIRAIGLSGAAEQLGGYPNGFISVASSHGYLAGVSSASTDMSRGAIATICYNVVMGGNGE